jgi:glycosyltransferase involved in cell wall biosynthesis
MTKKEIKNCTKSNEWILPSISIVIPTFNVKEIIKGCLDRIVRQNYPKEKIEIIVVDGGSTDGTVDIAKKYGAKIIHENTSRPEAATAIGYKHSQNLLIANLPADNLLPHKNWLKEMVQPFMYRRDISAVQTLHYTYCKDLNLLDRYFALFGAGDPLAYYLNKRDRVSWLDEKWSNLGTVIEDQGNFFVVEFDLHSDKIPTLGANGYLVKRDLISKVIADELNFFHVDSNIDLIKAGYNKFGIMKCDIIHRSGESFFKYFKKRIRYALTYFADRHRRKFHLYDSRYDKLNLMKFVLYSMTFLKSSYESIRGYKEAPDIAWLLHPVMCFITMSCYLAIALTRLSAR